MNKENDNYNSDKFYKNQLNQLDSQISFFLFSEYMGTFLLACAISASVMVDEYGNQTNDVMKLIIGLFTAIFCFNIGGADFNPGVTYVKYLTYKNSYQKTYIAKILLSYIIMQCLGSISGFTLFYYFNSNTAFKLTINKNISQSNAFVMEIFASFTLYFIIIVQAIELELTNHYIMRVFISVSAVATGISMGGKTSGAGMNPAIALGANLVRFINTGDLNEIRFLWIYIMGPLVACHMTAFFYNNVYRNEAYYIRKDKITQF
jgi:glycerol uptake facilitator-like aquaporin